MVNGKLLEIESLKLKFSEISEDSKERFKEEFSEMIIDYIADERDEDKIKYYRECMNAPCSTDR